MVEAVQQILTGADFDTEEAAWEHFDRIASRTEAFRVIHAEVEGWYIQPRPNAENGKRPRIDRIVMPSMSLIEAGWPHGPFGIEGKTSGKKIGKVMSQVLDYSRAAFELPHGFVILLQWVFVWPLDGAGGDLGSVMAQNRIGWVRSSARSPLVFGCGGSHGITINSDGTFTAKELPMGRKAGSR